MKNVLCHTKNNETQYLDKYLLSVYIRNALNIHTKLYECKPSCITLLLGVLKYGFQFVGFDRGYEFGYIQALSDIRKEVHKSKVTVHEVERMVK